MRFVKSPEFRSMRYNPKDKSLKPKNESRPFPKKGELNIPNRNDCNQSWVDLFKENFSIVLSNLPTPELNPME